MKLKLAVLLLLIGQLAAAQDIAFARKMVDTLTSPYFWGRGYTNSGLAKAAVFLTDQFKSYGLKPMDGKSYVQEFSYPVNTYPGKMEVTINGVALIPGKDFIIKPDTRGVKAEGTLTKKDSAQYIDAQNRIIVILEDKLTWSAEQKVEDYTVIEVDRNRIKGIPTAIKTNIESKFIPSFKTGNICAMIKGTTKPDSMIVFTAHYDHLGGMGADTYFPGANDNASGVTQLLSLARYYGAHPQPYTMAFILFSGEEAGLVGSQYFSEHPLVSLSKIRFLVNLDLEGTGVDGITVVNASVFASEFALLRKINDVGKYLVKINSRGKAANSDHYFFTDKGVPSFYMYTLGGIKAYHDVYDISATLPLDHHAALFQLLIRFNGALMNMPVN